MCKDNLGKNYSPWTSNIGMQLKLKGITYLGECIFFKCVKIKQKKFFILHLILLVL